MRTHRAKAWTYAVLIVMGVLTALPNVLPPSLANALPAWYAEQTVVLGLDLRGGSHLLLEVDTAGLARERTDRFAERITDQLREQGIRHGSPTERSGAVVIPLADPRQSEQAAGIASGLSRDGGRAAFSVDREGGALVLTPRKAFVEELSNDAVERSLEVVRRRLDATGVVEPTVARQGASAIIVQLPGIDDPARVRELLGTTARLTFHLVTESGTPTTESVVLPGPMPSERHTVTKRPSLEGEHVANASLAFDQNTNAPVVHFRLDAEGADRFAEITRRNLGRALAIVLDGRIITAPVIRGVIAGGGGGNQRRIHVT